MEDVIILIDNLLKIEKEICVGKRRAAGPDGEVGDPINLTEIIDKFNNPK